MEANNNDMFIDMLEKWAECTACDVSVPKKKKEYGLEQVDEYMKILPGAEYVLTQTLNYIFSNGLTTGSLNQDEVLDDFLYRKNEKGNTNLAELRSTVGMGITHGYSGLRWYDGNIYQYKWGEYKVLTYLNHGIEQVLGYVVAKDGKKVPAFDFNWTDYREYEDFIRDIDEKNLILLSPADFQPIRNDTSLWYGYSPLLKDRERLDLMVATYERLNYDIRYDGPGRIIIRPKDGYVSGTDVSTASVVEAGLKADEERVAKVKEEAARVANDMKASSSDSVIVLSNAFDKEIQHLPRVTKATEFLEWLKSDTMLLAQDFGMSPSLLELGGVSGNVSMTSIISTAMLNSIVPLRERYATQFSSFLANHLSTREIPIEKVYFDKYEMEQRENENTMRTKIVNIMSLLNAMDDENGVIRPEALQLFKDFGEMLHENIYNENEMLEELTVGTKG